MRLLCFVLVLGLASAAFAQEDSDPGTRIILQKDDGDSKLILEEILEPETKYEDEGVSIGVRGRYVTVPDAIFDSWLLDHTSFNSYSVGMEVGIDGPAGGRVIFSIDYTDLGMPSGNFRSDGDFPDEASFTEVDLHLIAFETLFLWKLAFSEWAGWNYGVALGVGYVPGSVSSVDVLPTCTHPVKDCGHWDQVTRREQQIPPEYYPTRFIPLLGVQTGIYFKPTQSFQIRLDAGMRLLLVYTGVSMRATF